MISDNGLERWRVEKVYGFLAELKLLTDVPSDVVGRVNTPMADLDLQGKVRQRAEAWEFEEYRRQWWLGAPASRDRDVMVLIVEAARLLSAGNRVGSMLVLQKAADWLRGDPRTPVCFRHEDGVSA